MGARATLRSLPKTLPLRCSVVLATADVDGGDLHSVPERCREGVSDNHPYQGWLSGDTVRLTHLPDYRQ